MNLERLAWSTLLLVAAGCGSGKSNGMLPPIDFGGGADGYVFTPVDLATGDGGSILTFDLGNDPGGPTVTILSPAEGSEVQYDVLTVQARITSASSTLASDSVKLLVPSGTPNVFASASMTLTAMADVYQGMIDISAIPSGPTDLSVAAEDVMGRRGGAREGYVHDHGPVITFVRPALPTAKGSLTVELLIDDSLHPLTDGSTVQVGVRTPNDVPMSVVAGAVPLRMTGLIDFSTFNPPLDGAQIISAQATNSKGTIGRATKQFTVDNVGPTITFVSPLAGTFIGGVVKIDVTVDDISGVNDSTVVAVFGGDPSLWSVPLYRMMPGGNEFTGYFDVRKLGRSYVLPTLSVRADDTLGNHSELGEEIVVDNTPPILSLDPPQLVVAKLDSGQIMCSTPFDPVGDESANDGDGQVIQQVITLKARVEDRGNDASGLLVVRISGLDGATVSLEITPAANAPLAVDTDGDGLCDDVNPLLVPTTNVLASNEALALQMVPLASGGSPDFEPYTTTTTFFGPTKCQKTGTATMPPGPLCTRSGTDLTYVLMNDQDPLPAIWTIPPVTSDQYGCIGLQLDTLNHLPEGPACAVVRAQDKAGNHNVSTPLRVCINRGGTPCASWSTAPLPDCTGTYDKRTNTVSSTKCTPEVFPSTGEVRRID
jgi:hypothetical protein